MTQDIADALLDLDLNENKLLLRFSISVKKYKIMIFKKERMKKYMQVLKK